MLGVRKQAEIKKKSRMGEYLAASLSAETHPHFERGLGSAVQLAQAERRKQAQGDDVVLAHARLSQCAGVRVHVKVVEQQVYPKRQPRSELIVDGVQVRHLVFGRGVDVPRANGGPAALGHRDRLVGPRKEAGVVVRGDVLARGEDEVRVRGDRPQVQVWLESLHLFPVRREPRPISLLGLRPHVIQVVPLKRHKDLRVGRLGFDLRVYFLVETDEVRRVVGKRVHVGVDLGGEAEVIRMERADDPQRVIGERRAHIGIGERRLPTCRQVFELASVQTVERVHHVDGVETVLSRQRLLPRNVASRFGFTVHAADKICPRDVVLEEDEVPVLAEVFEMIDRAQEVDFWRGGKEPVHGLGGGGRVARRERRDRSALPAGEGDEKNKEREQGESFHGYRMSCRSNISALWRVDVVLGYGGLLSGRELAPNRARRLEASAEVKP